MNAWDNAQGRKVANLLSLFALALVAFYLCYLVAKPFFGPLMVAVMLAIIFHPLHARTGSLLRRPNLAAAVSTVLVLLLAFVPLILLGIAVKEELRGVVQSLRQSPGAGDAIHPYVAHWRDVLMKALGDYMNLAHLDLRATLLRWAEEASRQLLSVGTAVITNLLSFALDTVVVFFCLFFFFRDASAIRQTLSALLPLDGWQTDRLFTGVSGTMIGNLYGILAVGAAQGLLTGISFWVLGLPAPVLWALITGLASMVPLVGSALVWVPAAILLLITGHWVKALLLLAWGATVVGQVDVLIRPLVVGAHLRVHTLLVFLALLGGVKAFGVSGIFIGPIVLSFALAVIDLLKPAAFSWSRPPEHAPSS
jgi:predicted PurR-regulated permease PerM